MTYKLIFAAAALTFAGAAQAQMVSANDPQTIISALQAGGYKASLDKDSTGDPRVQSAASGSKFVITFYGCTNNRGCKSVTFYAGWTGTKATMSQMNDWNKGKRWSRAYIDKDGDPVMEFDVDLSNGGISQSLFLNTVGLWEQGMGSFKKIIAVN